MSIIWHGKQSRPPRYRRGPDLTGVALVLLVAVWVLVVAWVMTAALMRVGELVAR